MNVNRLEDAVTFYTEALGFTPVKIETKDAALAGVLGVQAVRRARLQRGAQCVDLTQCNPPGAPYPEGSRSNELWFQHCALVTDDMAAAYARLCQHSFAAISRHGPQSLPGGIVAFKFRDPDGHPLELIGFPNPDPRTAGGLDHSAISVADVARSVAFYATELGLTEQQRQVNTGPAQDALDDLDGVRVDVVALAPSQPAPHVELLGYRTPRGRVAARGHASDVAATRLVFAADESRMLRDPDGHLVLLEK